MKPSEKIIIVRALLRYLVIILQQEHENNWIRGAKNALRSVTEPLSESPEKSLDNAWSDYRIMEGGYGTFSDYYIVREDFEEQVRLNRELSDVRAALWQLFTVE